MYENGWPILTHTNGDAATDMLITAVREAERAFPGEDRRTTIIHTQTIREDQLDAAKELGMIPSFFVNHSRLASSSSISPASAAGLLKRITDQNLYPIVELRPKSFFPASVAGWLSKLFQKLKPQVKSLKIL